MANSGLERDASRGASASRRKDLVSGRVELSGGQFWREHQLACVGALLRLLHTPLATFLTLCVMAIAVSLPTTLHVGLVNLKAFSAGWQGQAQLSLFLADSVDEQTGRDLAQQLADNTLLSSVSYLSRSEALAEFQRFTGQGDLLRGVSGNPLPAVILVEPSAEVSDPAAMDQLAMQLGAVQGVDEVIIDLAWVARLHALIAFAERVVGLLASLLALAVVLVIGNSIRLEIDNRREEVVIAKLVGATDAYVRRPFLYTGLWYGLGAGLLAWLMVQLTLWYLGGALSRLVQLYPGGSELYGLDALAALVMLTGSLLVGVAGAWLAVVRQLTAIVPR